MSTIRPDAPIAPEPAMIDGIFRALADPTRRQVLERLGERPASVSELAAHHPMALPSFLAHLKMLEGCGLVHSRKRGRVRTYSLAPDRLRLAEDWLATQRRLWEGRLDRMDSYLLSLQNNKETPR